MTQQYPRQCSLILTDGTTGIDLSEMRIRFHVSQADTESPNTAVIRVYNLSEATINQVEKEYQRVVLQAGYPGNFAVIFQGTITQLVKGRESALDSFLDIMAADGDEAYNFAVVNKALAAGASPQDQAAAIAQAMQPYGVDLGDTTGLTGGILPRGKVLFGLARARMSDLANTTATTWSIQNGKVTIIPLTGYLAGEAVALSARTGLVGIPEATIDGIEIRCLLNPMIRIGTRVQIDNSAINTPTVLQQGLFPTYGDITLPATVTRDGYYRVLVAEHTGDMRGQEFYTDLTCLAIDPSAAPDKSVQPYG